MGRGGEEGGQERDSDILHQGHLDSLRFHVPKLRTPGLKPYICSLEVFLNLLIPKSLEEDGRSTQ